MKCPFALLILLVGAACKHTSDRADSSVPQYFTIKDDTASCLTMTPDAPLKADVIVADGLVPGSCPAAIYVAGERALRLKDCDSYRIETDQAVYVWTVYDRSVIDGVVQARSDQDAETFCNAVRL